MALVVVFSPGGPRPLRSGSLWDGSGGGGMGGLLGRWVRLAVSSAVQGQWPGLSLHPPTRRSTSRAKEEAEDNVDPLAYQTILWPYQGPGDAKPTH